MGDSNSVVGDESYRNIVGPHALGRKNHRGQMLINFCERNGLIVTNTWFRKPKRRLYTWKAPGDWSRHHLDCVLVKHQFRNSVKDVQTLPGADIDSDHNILVAKICTILKKIIRFRKRRPRWDLEKLHAQRQRVQDILEEKLGALGCLLLLLLLLFFNRRYNPWWGLACFTISFHSLLFLNFCLQFLTFIFFKSSSTCSSHLSLGLPTGLDEHGSHLVNFLTVGAVGCESGNVELQWNNIKECVLDTISDLVGKVKNSTRKPWITQEMISKMDERRKWKNVITEENRKNYRRLRNELERVADNTIREYLENICKEIMEFQRTGLMI